VHRGRHSHQGCLSASPPPPQFSSYGLKSDSLPKSLLKAFYKYWWTTELGSKERKKIHYEVLQGPLVGKAVAVVTASGSELQHLARRGACPRPAGGQQLLGSACRGARKPTRAPSAAACRAHAPAPLPPPLPLPPTPSPRQRALLQEVQPRHCQQQHR
jgi:hypothetical protein